MPLIRLHSEKIIDRKTGVHCAFHYSLKGTVISHCHNFYEIFLITEGEVMHMVNGSRQQLGQGSLVFIRPDDIHYYSDIEGQGYKFINMAFSIDTYQAVIGYLGGGFPPDRLTNPSLPPLLKLPFHHMKALKHRLETLNLIPKTSCELFKAESRVLLVDLISRYYAVDDIPKDDSFPDWFRDLCLNMEQKGNFVAGMKRMLEISGKSHEHLCRVFRKHLGKTPTDYLNDRRLKYAVNLLANTDKDILSVAYECGFENLSHFYHLFKREFHVPPSSFRKSNRKSAVPYNRKFLQSTTVNI